MNKYEPTYEKGREIRNELTDEIMIILGMRFDKEFADIVYKMQGKRYKFNIREIPETVIDRNIETGDYKLIEQ